MPNLSVKHAISHHKEVTETAGGYVERISKDLLPFTGLKCNSAFFSEHHRYSWKKQTPKPVVFWFW